MHKMPLVAKAAAGRGRFVIYFKLPVDWATPGRTAPRSPAAKAVGGVRTASCSPPTPVNHVSLRCTFKGRRRLEEKEKLMADLRLETDVKKRRHDRAHAGHLLRGRRDREARRRTSPWTPRGASSAATSGPRPACTSGTRGWRSRSSRRSDAEGLARAERPRARPRRGRRNGGRAGGAGADACSWPPTSGTGRAQRGPLDGCGTPVRHRGAARAGRPLRHGTRCGPDHERPVLGGGGGVQPGQEHGLSWP